MKNYSAKDVDAYIASAPTEAQPKLEELRKVILLTVPGAEEGISWGIPFYKHHGVLAGFAAFADHVSFGFYDALRADIRKNLEAEDYKTGAKTIQIRFDQVVPSEIRSILKDKATLNEAKRPSA